MNSQPHRVIRGYGLLALCAFAAIALCASPSLAQDAVTGAPPTITLSRSQAPWMGMAIMFLLLAIVMFISLIPSKRGHQD